MAEFRYVTERESAAKHTQHQATRQKLARHRESSSSGIRNVEPVLSLNEMTYLHFRGRAFGVPPLPWKAGQRMLQVYTATIANANVVSQRGDKKAEADYFAGLAQLQSLLWRYCYPVGWGWRLLRMLGLHRNPFRVATEKEILDHTDFFLQLRMKSNVRSSPELKTELFRTPTRLTS